MYDRRKVHANASKIGRGRRVAGQIVVVAIVAAMVTSSFVGFVTPAGAATVPEGVIGVSQCGTLDQANQEYWLTQDILDVPRYSTCFTIAADGVTLDGQGHTIRGADDGYQARGVYVRANDAVVKNATLDNVFWGVELYGGVSNGEVRDLLVTRTSYPISSNAGNYVGGSNHLIANNEIVGGTSIQVNGGNNITIRDNTLRDGGTGIEVRSVLGVPVDDNVIIGNTISGYYWGVRILGGGTNNFVTDNVVSDSRYENVLVDGMTGTRVLRNAVTGEGTGIQVSDGTGSIVSENRITNLGSSYSLRNAINVLGGTDVEVSDNVVRNVSYRGIWVTNKAENVRVLRNTVADIGNEGISVRTSPNNVRIADNVIERTYISVSTAGATNVTIATTKSSEITATPTSPLSESSGDHAQFRHSEVVFDRFETSTATLSGTAYATDFRALRTGETLPTPPVGFVAVGPRFFVTGKTGGVLDDTVYFDGLTLHYTDADVSSLDESSLQMWAYDTATGTWASLSGPTVDADANTVTVDRWTFSGAYYVALFGQSEVAVTITNPEDGAVLNTTSVLLTGTATSTTGAVTDVEVSLDGGAFQPAALSGSEWSYPLDSLAEGEHTIVVRAEDELGITSTSDVSFTVDTTPPAIEAISFDPTLVGGGDTVTVTVAAADANGVTSVTADGESLTQDASGNWTGTLTAPTSDGPATVDVVATDLAGNQATASDSYAVDATAPTLTLSAPAENTTGTVEVTGSATDEHGVASADLLVDGAAQSLALAADGSFAVTLTLDEGTHTLTLRATDTVGNTAETSTTVTVDLNDPPVADAGPDQIVNELMTVTLDASGSLDADSDTLTYVWTQTTGPTVTLSDATAVAPTFTAPEVSESTALAFEVNVSDGEAWDTDTTTVTVEPVVHIVPIDVDPTDVDNNVSTKGVIRVAVYGTSDVAASDIAAESLRFGNESTIASGGGASPVNTGQVRDVDGDGRDDLTVAFRADLSGLVPGDTLAVMVGDLVDGTELRGEDGVTVEEPGGGSAS